MSEPRLTAAYVALYPMLVQIAHENRYALAVHGSVHRDFDLIAVPWAVDAADPEVVLNQINKELRLGLLAPAQGIQFPHGRIAYTLPMPWPWDDGYLDISFMPRLAATPAGKPAPPEHESKPKKHRHSPS